MCHIFEQKINHCVADLSLNNEDTRTYGFAWSAYRSLDPLPTGFDAIHKSFQYQTSEQLSGLPYTGKYNTYQASGYVYELRGKLSFVQGNLTLLKQMGWIDGQTRGLFAEFSLYNPNLNLVVVGSILFEFLPFGKIITSGRFDIVNLFFGIQTSAGGFDTLKLLLYAAYMLVIVYTMIVELCALVKHGFLTYIKEFWHLVAWSLISLSWYSLAMFVYRVVEANKVMSFFARTNGYAYMNLATLSAYNQSLSISLGLCCALSTIQFLRVFKMSNRIYSLVLTLQKCKRNLVGFLLVFLFFWMCFSNWVYLVFKDYLVNYSTYLHTVMSLFLVTQGKVDTTEMIAANEYFAPVFYVSFNVVVVMVVINVLVGILTEAYGELRDEIRGDYDFLDYCVDMVRDFYERCVLGKKRLVYKHFDRMGQFKESVERILKYVDQV